MTAWVSFGILVLLSTVGRPGDGWLSAGFVVPRQTDGGAQGGPTASIACGPDRPVVSVGEGVAIHAWVGATNSHQMRYVWKASAGKITGSGAEVTWSFADSRVSPGTYQADVRVSDKSSPLGSCSFRVVVVERERGPNTLRETGRAFLVRGSTEQAGYGLYSYLLLGLRAAESTRQRYLSVLEAYLDAIQDVMALEEVGFETAKLNITYLPLRAAPTAKDAAAVFLENYDYARARELLDLMPGARRNGIYLVSSLRPLGSYSGGPLLVQDLSTVPSSPKELIGWWVRAFLNQCAQERFWKGKTGEQLALRMRTIVAVIAESVPEIRRSVTDWISWLH